MVDLFLSIENRDIHENMKIFFDSWEGDILLKRIYHIQPFSIFNNNNYQHPRKLSKVKFSSKEVYSVHSSFQKSKHLLLRNVSLRKTSVSREDIFRIEKRYKYSSLLTLSEKYFTEYFDIPFEHGCEGTTKRLHLFSGHKTMQKWCTIFTKYVVYGRLGQVEVGINIGEVRS